MKAFRARAARLLAAVGGLFALAAFPAALFAYQTADTLTLTVRTANYWPPAPVNDLTAAPGSEGQALLQWTAPIADDGLPLPQTQPVSSYMVRLATFSADSLAGDTAAWWDLAADADGEPVPLAPGTTQSLLLNGLTPGASYFFAIRSTDDAALTSAMDAGTAGPGQQAYVLTADAAPATPQNFSAAGGNAQILLTWTDLTALEKTSDFGHYRLERSLSGAGFVLIATTTAAAYLDTGLTNGTAYIYRLIAVDKGSPGAALESPPSLAAATPQAAQLTPAIVAGLSGELSADGKSFTIRWSTVSTRLDGSALADLAGYRILKSTSLLAGATTVFNITPPQTYFIDAADGQKFYYRVLAVDASGNESPDSNSINSSNASLAAEGTDGKATLTVPVSISEELHKESNGTGSDLVITATHLSGEETGDVLKSYLFEARRAENNQPVAGYAFSRPLLNITFWFVKEGGAGTLAQSDTLSIYWDNGAGFVELGGRFNYSEGTVSVLSPNFGRYQLRLVSGQAGPLSAGSPYPRIITPNGDGINDRVFFFFGTTAARKEGRIYDLTGALVGSLKPGPVADSSLIWDGTDGGGHTVPMGIYLYKVTIGDKTTTGTLAVAR